MGDKMNKTIKQIAAVFIFALLALPAGAALNDAVWHTRNADVDALGEQITSTGPTKCAAATVCNASGTASIVYVGYDASATAFAAGTTLSTSRGVPLFSTTTSGPTCWTVNATVFTSGAKAYVNSRYFYAEGAGANRQVSLACEKAAAE